MFFLKKFRLKNLLVDKLQEDCIILLICLGIFFVFWLFVKFFKEYIVVWEVQLFYELLEGKVFISFFLEKVVVNFKF